MKFSIIVPVFNRPEECKELLESLANLNYEKDFEIVIVEDGSTETSKEIVDSYKNKLNISYYFKENSGPGDSRNFGMQKATGDYFIIFDSDCIIPSNYLSEVEKELLFDYVDFFGGSDKALPSFSNIQKAINFSMTSFLTTGGIRGGSEKINKFQPRSFNMGISKTAFHASNGFGNIHPGEDPDLTIRLWKLGYKSRLFSNAFVYHKRRIDWEKFSLQVSKFGKARPILNHWHPEFKKNTYWFPTLFVVGFYLSIISLLLLFDIPLKLYFLYFLLIFIVATIQNKSIIIGYYSIIATWKQFFGYGLGFLESFVRINIFKQKPEKAFPKLFFNHTNTVINQKFNIQVGEVEKLKQVHENEEILKQVHENVQNNNEILIRHGEQYKAKIIGLTGGIGSGKSTIAKMIEDKGFPVYVADVEAKKVMELSTVTAKIQEVFGNEIIDDGKIVREKLAAIVFNEPDKLKKLNAIVHPEVKNHFTNWVANNQKHPLIFKEAAILFESGSYKDCDAVISVIAPLETRIERVIKRDTTTREKVLERIKNQISDEERIAKSNYTITNINLEDAKNQLVEILNLLKNK